MSRSLRSLWRASGRLSGGRFVALVASSTLATTAVIGAALGGAGDSALLAALANLGVAGAPTQASPAAAGQAPPTAADAALQAAAPAAPVAPRPAVPARSNTPAAVLDRPHGPSSDAGSGPSQPPAWPYAGRVKHVFVVTLHSSGYDSAFGERSQMPYLATTLRPKGALLSGYSLIDAAGLPNYLAMIGGQQPNDQTRAECPRFNEFPAGAKPDRQGQVPGSGCVYPVEAITLADQLNSAGLSWRAYVEGMADARGPRNCVHPGLNTDDTTQSESPSHEYVARHNPFVYFLSLLDLGACATNDVPLEQLDVDLGKLATSPSYSFISSDLCRSGAEPTCADGSQGGPGAADEFLAELVPRILDSAAYKRDGLLAIVFAEGGGPPADGGDSKRVGALLISPFATPGATLAGDYDAYGLLRSTEDLLGVSRRGPRSAASFAPALVGDRD
ncbi:MAG: hypothetical protein QOG09_990 [Solirubrobacterales bacterium]|jgi:hypothetical protein|nr:hypothetical protein [Solirubrobacterales bacterium]